MFIILSVILLIVVCAHQSNQASVISRFNYEENDVNLNSNENQREYENEFDINEFVEYKKNFLTIDPHIADDTQLNTPQLISKYGYKAEVHYVTTEDGYILQLHRIAGGPKSPPRKGKKVCFYMHGIMDSSAGIILSGPNQALGYILADNDYDVWLGNSRGNYYSVNHTTYKPFGSRKDRKHFWSFSWHEIGIYDLPASIDYILAATGESKLQYIGHSQGAAAFFVMASERSEYNDKIEMMHAVAPVAFSSHIISPPIRAITPFVPVIQKVKGLIGFDYFNPSKKFRIMAGELLCRDKVPTQIICTNMLFLMMGYASDQMNTTLLPVILGHTPAGGSTNQFIHYGQLVNSGHFRQYDYGRIRNRMKYKRFSPPDYNLSNVRVPIAIFHSRNDWLATVKDIEKLLTKLPNVVKTYLIPHKEFNHIDFLWGTDAPILLYYEILKTMKSSQLYSQSDKNWDMDNENSIVEY